MGVRRVVYRIVPICDPIGVAFRRVASIGVPPPERRGWLVWGFLGVGVSSYIPMRRNCHNGVCSALGVKCGNVPHVTAVPPCYFT